MTDTSKAGIFSALKPVRFPLIVCFAVMAAASVAYLVQFQRGLILTDLNNLFSWGLYVSGLAFFVGNAAGGLVLSSSIYLFGLKELKPFARLGALTALVNVICAMISILPDIGQPLRLWHLLVYPQFTSPLVWDIIILNIYAALTTAYLFVLLIPDIYSRLPKPIAAIIGSDPAAFSDKWAHRLAPVALFFAVGIHVVTAWIFSTQGGREWWFTAALAPDFVSVAVMAGTTLVLLFATAIFGNGKEFDKAFATMRTIITAACIFHFFLMYNEIFIKTWYHHADHMEVFAVLFKEYLPVHLFEVLAPVIAIVLLYRKKVQASKGATIAAAILLLAGVLAHRFLIMPPAFNAVPLTIAPAGFQHLEWAFPVAAGRALADGGTFISRHHYLPSIVEWVIFSGVISFACATILLGSYLLPIRKRNVEATAR